MADPAARGPWVRRHKNGAIAAVSWIPTGDDLYTYTARQPGIVRPDRTVHGLANAQTLADAEANCEKCKCPPWNK